MTVDEALNIAVIHTLSIKHGIAVSEAAEAASIIAAEVRLLRDEVNGLTGSLDRAEKALKEAQEQPAVPEMTDDALEEILNAAQIVGYDDPLRIVRGFVMRVLQEWGNQEGMHKAFLDAVKPAVVVPAVPAVPDEWREVMTELAADVQAACDAEHPHRDQYPSVMRKYNNDMKIVEKARALLQSLGGEKP